MSIKESALNAITSITQSDFIRAVTAAGASRRVTVANLAKAIIESYTGSSLAGENQSVKSALDAINSKPFGKFEGSTLTDQDDLNDLSDTGRYLITSSSIPSEAHHYPFTGTGSGGFMDVISRGNDQVWQFYYSFNNKAFRRMRFSISTGGTWTAWAEA